MRHFIRTVYAIPVFLALSLLAFPTMAQTCPAPQPLSNMTLTFDDEFNEGLLDNTKWTAVAMGGADAINSEQEDYVPSGVQMIQGGGVRLQVNNKPFWSQQYTSGAIKTNGHFLQAYGHFEMKAKLPDGNGLWPAFWMLSDHNNNAWPPEIDVLEYVYMPYGAIPGVPDKTSYAHQGLIWATATGRDAFGNYTYGDFGSAYHTYAIDWRPGSLVYLYDGVVQSCVIDNATTGQRVPNVAMYMIANLAIGTQGGFTGSVNGMTSFPANMDIAYIRAYQFKDVTPPAPEPILVMNANVSNPIASPGATITISADVVIGNSNLPGPTQTQFFIQNYDATKTINEIQMTGPATYQANHTYHFSFPYTIPATMAPGVYPIAINALYNNWQSYQWFSVTSGPTITVVAAACGSTPSGQTIWINGATGSSSAVATTQQCPYGGTVGTTWLNQNQQLCTNGVLSNTGQTQQINIVTASPVCNAPPSDTITIIASGDDYLGPPQMGVLINGQQVETASVTAIHSTNQWQTFTYTLPMLVPLQSLSIRFLNDAYGGASTKDRNLYVKSVTINGVQILPAIQNMYSSGTFTWNTNGTYAWKTGN